MDSHAEAEGIRFKFRQGLTLVGDGAARQVYFGLLSEGFDAILASCVVYNIAEGFSREAGNPDADPERFHEGPTAHVGADLPEGLDADDLRERARDAMRDPALFDGLEIGDIEAIAMVIGRDMLRDAAAPRP